MMYEFQETSDELSWKPYHRVSKGTYFLALAIVVSATIIVLIPSFSYEVKEITLYVGAILFLWSLYDIFLRPQHRIIFDKQHRKAYIKYYGIFKKKLFDFENICIMNAEQCGGKHYGISHKKNRYGKTYPISNDFADDDEMIRFEKEIIPEIYKILER